LKIVPRIFTQKGKGGLLRYRAEIDGLRAVAVIPVILFHAGFKTFSGGFVGVDIFFVISGYLITSIILSEMEEGTFSLLNFYERRARRILPALFFVMFACLPFAWLWLVPADMTGFSESLAAVSAFASNVLFWRTSGYFETAAELKPLLHTWSLAVEEQYYLLFPLFLMGAWRSGKRWILSLLVIAAIISLVAAQWGSVKHPVASFYLLPTRGWELLIGAFVAFYYSNNRKQDFNRFVSQAGSAIGLMLLIYAIFAFDHQTPFPSLYTLIPTVGAALILLFAAPKTWVGVLLGNKFFVGVGLVSYSAYLWHQPLFTFAKHRSMDEPSKLLLGSLAVASVGFAYFSWKYIEMPFRSKQRFSRKKIFTYGAVGTVCFICVGLAGHFTSGFESRFDLPKSIADSFKTTDRSTECLDRPSVHTREDWYCDSGLRSDRVSFVVFGDSHSLSLFDTFNAAAANNKQYGVFTAASGCTPFLGIYALRGDQAERDCFLLNKRVFDYVKSNNINKVFLVARWTYYTDGGYDGTNFSYIGLSKSDAASKEVSRKAFVYGLQKTIEAYADIGVKLYIVTQVPQQKHEPKDIYYKLYNEGGATFSASLVNLSISRPEHQQLQSYVMSLFKTYEERNLVRLISFDDIFCDERKCLIGTIEKSYYLDNNHLSGEGEHLVLDVLRNILVSDEASVGLHILG
jgi:peptidoglycan/LPS O-acetylase OafA/YrhL